MSSTHIVCTTARQTSLFLVLFLFSEKCIAQEVDNSVKTQSIFLLHTSDFAKVSKC